MRRVEEGINKRKNQMGRYSEGGTEVTRVRGEGRRRGKG